MNSFDHKRKPKPQALSNLQPSGSQTVTPTLGLQTIQRARTQPTSLQPNDLQMLQSSMGNNAVNNLIGRNQPAVNSIQRQENEESENEESENETGNVFSSNVDEVFGEESNDESVIDDDFEDELEEESGNEEEAQEEWSPSSFHHQYGISNNVPFYSTSPQSVRKKMGRRHRLWNKFTHRGALALDRARNKVTRGTNMPITERVESKDNRKYIKTDQELMMEHYKNHLSRKDFKRFRKQFRNEERAHSQQAKSSARISQKSAREKAKDLRWLKKRRGMPMVDF